MKDEVMLVWYQKNRRWKAWKRYDEYTYTLIKTFVNTSSFINESVMDYITYLMDRKINVVIKYE